MCGMFRVYANEIVEKCQLNCDFDFWWSCYPNSKSSFINDFDKGNRNWCKRQKRQSMEGFLSECHSVKECFWSPARPISE